MRWPEDLRLRIVAAFLAIACLSQVQSLAVAASAFALTAFAALISGAAARHWRRLLHVEAFLVLLMATLPFTIAGQPLVALGPFTASAEGAVRAASILCRVSASVLIALTMLGDVEPVRFGAALRDLRVPERLTRLFVLTARYVTLIGDEGRRLHDAMRARAFRPRSNLHTWRSYGNLIGMLLVRALDRAHRVEEAMLCRGFAGHFPRTVQGHPPLRDWIALALIAAAGFAALAADWR
jgi:cobalt/nickel transport system permease protein